MEIIETGDLRQIGYELTEAVKTARLFRGIYGVGESRPDNVRPGFDCCQCQAPPLPISGTMLGVEASKTFGEEKAVSN
jgi:hypothetical protein